MGRDPIRVLSLTDVTEIGGSEKRQITLARALNPENIVVRTLILRPPGILNEALADTGQKVRSLHLGKLTFKPATELLKVLTEFRPDIIHGQLRWSGLLAGAALRFVPRSRLAVSRVHTVRHSSRLVREIERLTYRRANSVVSVCEAAARMVRELAPKTPVTVIPNGVDLSRFAGVREYRPSDKLHIVCVANFNPVKGHAMLLAAAEILKNQNLDFEITLVGRGPLRRELELRAKEKALPITFAGRQKDVLPFLSKADLFALPSLSEGMSNALIEAMAAGLPQVATHVGGNPEVMVQGQTGLLSEPRSAESMAACIIELGRDRSRLLEMSRASKTRAEREFSETRMIDRYESFYTQEKKRLDQQQTLSSKFLGLSLQ